MKTAAILVTLVLCPAIAIPAAQAATLTVNAGGDLQAALDAAKPGDTIVLQAGATFTGNYKLPAKGGTAFITIRSSASDGQLPAAGVRIDPSYAARLPKIQSNQNGAAIRTSAGASYWRLQFIELRPAVSTASANLIELGSDTQTSLSAVPQHLVIDRCYIHGDASYGQRRGIALNSGDTQILNSYLADFKQANQDTQAIAGWNGPGPYLIENNYIEAAAENLMFGGSDPKIANLVPSNITIRRNTISKPMAWKTQNWTIKNLIEFKNAKGILIEGNVIENNWMAGQQGYSILFDVRNQSGTAPWSVVRDVVFQNNIVRHVAAVFNIMGWDDLHPSQQTQNIRIRNNLMYNISKHYTNSSTAAPGRLAIIGAQPADIAFDHNTVDNDGSSTIFIYGGYSATGSKAIAGFEVTNNLLRDNSYAIYGDKYNGEGTVGLSHYAPAGVVLANAFGGGSAKQYPAGNLFPSMAQWIADFVSEATANYQLVPSSLSINAGTDGKDLGVDFDELNAALSGSAAPAPPSPPTPPPSSSGSTAYGGTPTAIPGTIQFENYDAGGEGVAYHDTTSGNSGGAYRSNNVDLQGTSDSGGGYNLAWVKAGEWLNYTVDVAQAGSYTLTVRVASNGSGGAFHVEVNGSNLTGTITVPNTGGWQTWKTITKSGVALSSGQHVLKVVMDSNSTTGSVANFNWMAFAASSSSTSGGSSPHGGSAPALPGTVQVENYDDGGEGVGYHDTTSGNSGGAYRSNNVDIQATSDSGGGYDIGWVKAGEWLNYSVNVAQKGVYSIDVRTASNGSGGTFHIEADGADVTGSLTVPNTGAWQTWKTVSKTGVSLDAGPQVLRLVMDGNGGSGSVGNFNWIRVY